MDPNVITTLAGVVAIVVGAWRISGQISALSARIDGMEKHFDARLGNLEREVHAINEYLRHRQE